MREERSTRRAVLGSAVTGFAISVAGCSAFENPLDSGGAESTPEPDDGEAELAATIRASAADRAEVYGHFGAMFSPEHKLEQIASNEVPGAVKLLGEMEAIDGFTESPPADAITAVDVAPSPSPVDVLTETASHYDTVEQTATRSVLMQGSVTEIGDSDSSSEEAWEASNTNDNRSEGARTDDDQSEATDSLAEAATVVADAAEQFGEDPSDENRSRLVTALEAERAMTQDIDEIREWARIEPGFYSDGAATTQAARVVRATAVANVNAVVAFRTQIGDHLARLTDRTVPTQADAAESGGGPVDVPRTASFAEGFENGSLDGWTPLELPDHARSFDDSNDWSITGEAITGDHALHVSTLGDVNENAIATVEPVIDLSRDFTLGWSWHTPDPSNRGPRLRLLGSTGTDFTGDRSADYADSLRMSLDGDAISREGSPWTGKVSLGDATADRPSYAVDTAHTVRIRKQGSTATLTVDGDPLVETDRVATSGRYRLVLLTSGTWGDSSSMTFDDVFVDYE